MIRLAIYIMVIFISIIAYCCNNSFIQHLFSTDGSFGLFNGNVIQKDKLGKFDYIRDGLVHWYDSEINSQDKKSHKSGVIPEWKDLIGNHNLSFTSDTSLYFGEYNGLIVSSNRTSGICVANIPSNDCITIEICCAPLRLVDYLNEEELLKVDNIYTILAQGSNNGESYNFSAPFFISYIDGYNNWRKTSSDSRENKNFIIARGEDFAWRVFSDSQNIFYDFFLYYDYYGSSATTTFSVTNNAKSENNSNNVSNISYPYSYGWMKICSIDLHQLPDIDDPSYGIYKTTDKSNGIEGSASEIILYKPDGTPIILKPDIEKIKIKENELQVGGTRYFDSETNKYIEENLFSGYIFCIRIYNRVLTDEEREHNADIDLARFYKSWPDKNK